jgi:hypothetical protein
MRQRKAKHVYAFATLQLQIGMQRTHELASGALFTSLHILELRNSSTGA